MTAWSRFVTALRAQAGAAPWLKWALPVVAMLALATVWQALESLRTDLQQSAIGREVELRRILALQGEDVWFERAKQATELRDRLRAEMPPAATAGLAQASFQSWLQDSALAGLPADAIRISGVSSSTIDGLDGVRRVQATLGGALSARQALGVLRQIESSDNLIVVETTMIRSDQNPMFTATLNAYYRLQPGSADP